MPQIYCAGPSGEYSAGNLLSPGCSATKAAGDRYIESETRWSEIGITDINTHLVSVDFGNADIRQYLIGSRYDLVGIVCGCSMKICVIAGPIRYAPLAQIAVEVLAIPALIARIIEYATLIFVCRCATGRSRRWRPQHQEPFAAIWLTRLCSICAVIGSEVYSGGIDISRGKRMQCRDVCAAAVDGIDFNSSGHCRTDLSRAVKRERQKDKKRKNPIACHLAPQDRDSPLFLPRSRLDGNSQ